MKKFETSVSKKAFLKTLVTEYVLCNPIENVTCMDSDDITAYLLGSYPDTKFTSSNIGQYIDEWANLRYQQS